MKDRRKKKQQQEAAIVGVACRLPDANNYYEFWDNLVQGKDSVTEIKKDRWDIDKYYSTDINEPQKSLSKWCAQIAGVDKFDNRFFNISPREAKNMDPQQRLLLEEAWHCIEDSGIPLKELQQKITSVYVGVMSGDYQQESANSSIPTDSYAALGNYDCILANRISYAFGFEGVSLSIDAACASSLVAIHNAKASLFTGESDYAIAAGVNLNLHPWKYISFSKSRMLSPDGRCKTFDKDANGYVPGDGVGVVLLQPLENALRDGNQIYGIVKGSAVNHTGQGKSITAPRVDSQKTVIKKAYYDAGISPETVSYAEAHGTGTSLGDPVEIEAATKAFTELMYEEHEDDPNYIPEKNFCKIGSVKTNIGHLEAAAGIAGVIKLLMMIRHRKIPRILHNKKLNPIINFEQSPFSVVTELQDWESVNADTPQRASVSSFGFGGANSHAIIEEHIHKKGKNEYEHGSLFILSAQNSSSLKNNIEAWKKFTKTSHFEEMKLGDISATLTTGRSSFPYRYGFYANSKDELIEKLEKEEKIHFKKTEKWCLRIGSFNWEGMKNLQELLKASSIFSQNLNLVRMRIDSLGVHKDIQSSFFANEWKEHHQKLFSFIVGHAFLLTVRDLGFSPQLLTCEGSGAWNGLAVSGIVNSTDIIAVLSLQKDLNEIELSRPKLPFYDPVSQTVFMPYQINADYIDFLIKDSKIQQEEIDHVVQKTLLLQESQFTFKKYLEEWDFFLQKKGLNLNNMLHDNNLLQEEKEGNQKLRVLLTLILRNSLRQLNLKWELTSQKLHVFTEDRILEILDLLADNVLPKKEFIEMVIGEQSNFHKIAEVLNQRQEFFSKDKLKSKSSYLFLKERNQVLNEITDNAQWLQDLGAINSSLPENKGNGFIDFGHLKTPAEGDHAIHVPIPSSHVSEIILLNLWLNGIEVHWEKLFQGKSFCKVSLPTYSFNRKSHWLKKDNIPEKVPIDEGFKESSIIGSRLTQIAELEFKRLYSSTKNAIIRDHVITGKTIIPAASLIEQGLEAVHRGLHDHIRSLKNLVIRNPGIVDNELPIHIEIKPKETSFIVKSNNQVLCEGKFNRREIPNIPSFDYKKYLIEANQVSIKNLYSSLAESGYQYGKSLQIIEKVWYYNDEYVFQVKNPSYEKEGNITRVSPFALDGVFQAILASEMLAGEFPEKGELYVPYIINSLNIFRNISESCLVRVDRKEVLRKERNLYIKTSLYSREGEPL
ncbi:MAG: 3-oxoacyl-(acyl-carrier-protein) synthase, partial [bacterium]